MKQRGIKGTTDWARHAVVLDVAADATMLNYGLLFVGGPGTAWLDGASLEVVDASVDVTDILAGEGKRKTGLEKPVNLDLED